MCDMTQFQSSVAVRSKRILYLETVPILKIMDGRNTPIHEKFYEVGSSIDLQCVAYSLPSEVAPTWTKSGIGTPIAVQVLENFTETDST